MSDEIKEHDKHNCEVCEQFMDKEEEVEVAPNIYQSREDYVANMAFDEARDNEL